MGLAVILIILPLFIAILFVVNTSLLLPAGYELAKDGYVVSRTLFIVFILYLLFKMGILIYKQKAD